MESQLFIFHFPLSPSHLSRRGWFTLAIFWLASTISGAVLAQDAKSYEKEIAVFALEAPRIRAMLELASAAEIGRGQTRSLIRAAMLYCDAAAQGSAEAQYRLGRMFLSGNGVQKSLPIAATLFSIASGNGHLQAHAILEQTGVHQEQVPECLTDPEKAWAAYSAEGYIDIERYADALPKERRLVAAIIRKLAPLFDVDLRLALAIAAVESNFNPLARSPKNAMGVMQLIPETAERFNVKNAFNAEQNVRGGLAYLRWLLKRFSGDLALVAAAYNAGEGAVDRYKGVPPYSETKSYVRRVMQYQSPPNLQEVRKAVRWDQ